MITGSVSGDIQYFKTLVFGDYKFLRFVNIRYKGEKISFPLLYSDAYFKKTLKSDDRPNCVICCSPLRYILLKNSKCLAIFCNSAFLRQLDDEEQVSVILHEVGHFVSGHLKPEDGTETFEQLLQHEFEADAFACRHGYAVALASSLAKTLPPDADNEEIRLRIRNIKEKFAA